MEHNVKSSKFSQNIRIKVYFHTFKNFAGHLLLCKIHAEKGEDVRKVYVSSETSIIDRLIRNKLFDSSANRF